MPSIVRAEMGAGNHPKSRPTRIFALWPNGNGRLPPKWETADKRELADEFRSFVMLAIGSQERRQSGQ